MTPRHASPSRPRAVRHARRLRSHGILRSVAIVATAVLAFGAAGAAAVYTRIQGNIDAVDISDLVGPAPESTTTHDPDDPYAGQEVNILIMGSDERDGENAAIGGSVDGMRSDTTIVVHISADRQRIDLVSIPRDSLVDIPSCTMTDGSTSKAQQSAMFNSAFAIGADQGGNVESAAACTIKTVQANTGLTIPYFVVVDFAGFIRMVDALGGVPICIANDMTSPKAGLYLTAGKQTLDGSTALAFARARTGTGVGDGSDTNRLGRQQELIAATVREVLSKNLLTDIPQLIRFLDAATESITADQYLGSITNLAGLGYSLRSISTSNITFRTIPFATAPNDPNRVVWTPDADQIWSNMVQDVPLDTPVGGTPTAPDTTTPGTTATTDPTVPDTTATTPAAGTKEPGKEAFTANDETAVCG
ncbi:MAG TPA: LCP family protein [Cellulomonas sp.]